MKKKVSNYISWIITLVVLLIVSNGILVYFSLSGALIPKIASTGNFTLGDEIRLSAYNNKATSCSQTYSGNFLPNSYINQNVIFDFDENFSTSYIRIKATTTDDNNNILSLKFMAEKDWIFLEDGYYYYTKPVEPIYSLRFCSKIQTPENSETFSSKKTYTITYTLENVPATNSYLETFWKISPTIFV